MESTIHTTVFQDPCQMLAVLEHEFAKRPKESNIIYAHAFKLANAMRSGQSIAPGQFWIACYSSQQATRAPPTLDLVLACTESTMGKYPIFIYSHRAAKQCTAAYLEPRINALVKALCDTTPATRVFSVFSLSLITKIFADAWFKATGIATVPEEPWYSATSSYCTKTTFKGSRNPSDPRHVLRRATISDLDECTKLCKEFAATSPPFTLSEAQARKEADYMIRNRLLWVYELPAFPGSESESDGSSTSSASSASSSYSSSASSSVSSTPFHPAPSTIPSSSLLALPSFMSTSSSRKTAISSIVAVTRTTPTVSAITKVYTSRSFRRRGCADRLVAHVTNELLHKEGKDAVVLYVGHTLDAVRVYQRVGFVGLEASPCSNSSSGSGSRFNNTVESVEDWLELGFQGATLGHW